jgi:type II secretory pathway component PulM
MLKAEMMEKLLSLRSLSGLRARYYSLSNREQWALKIGVLALLTFLVLQFLLFPLDNRVKRLESSVRTKEKDLTELRTIADKYKRLPQPSSAGRSGEAFNLFSTLESQVAKSGLMEKIEYMRPGAMQLDNAREEKWVEVKVNRVTLKEMTSLLYNLESFGRGVFIKRLSARKDGDYLTLILQPAVVETKQPSQKTAG